jgi:hypothetical protein
VSFAAPEVRFVSDAPVPPPLPPPADVPNSNQLDEPEPDLFGPGAENLMLTDPLAYEEMVERALRERVVP